MCDAVCSASPPVASSGPLSVRRPSGVPGAIRSRDLTHRYPGSIDPLIRAIALVVPADFTIDERPDRDEHEIA
jgi:hypothetical protein